MRFTKKLNFESDYRPAPKSGRYPVGTGGGGVFYGPRDESPDGGGDKAGFVPVRKIS